MDRANQLFIFFCFMVFFFTGCKKPGSNSVDVKGPKGGSAQGKLNQKAEAQKKDLAELRGLLAESDTLFTQVWQVIAKKKDQNPSNPFRVVNDLLKEAQQTSMESPKSLKNKTAKAEENRKAETTAPLESDAPVARLVVNEVKPKDGLPYTDYQLFFLPPIANPKEQPYVAHFIKKNGSFWKIVINPEGFTQELNAFGPLTQLELDKKQAMISCELAPTSQGRLTKLNCGNMGQDLDEHRFFSLETFFLNLENIKKPLHVYGKILNSSTRKETSIEIQDFAELNELLIKEKVISRGDDEEAPPTSTQPVRNEGTAETSGAGSENRGNDNKNGDSQAQPQSKDQRNDGSLVVDTAEQEPQQAHSLVPDENAQNEKFNDRRFTEQQERESREKERHPNQEREPTPRSSDGEAPPPPEAVT